MVIFVFNVNRFSSITYFLLSDSLFVVTGADQFDESIKANGYILDVESGKVLKTWAPDNTVCSLPTYLL